MEIPPNTILFLNPTQPSPAGAPTAVTAMGGVNHTLPFGAATDRLNLPDRSDTTEDAGACPYKGSGPSFVQLCHKRDYK